jgi:hypothetical protein
MGGLTVTEGAVSDLPGVPSPNAPPEVVQTFSARIGSHFLARRP